MQSGPVCTRAWLRPSTSRRWKLALGWPQRTEPGGQLTPQEEPASRHGSSPSSQTGREVVGAGGHHGLRGPRHPTPRLRSTTPPRPASPSQSSSLAAVPEGLPSALQFFQPPQPEALPTSLPRTLALKWLWICSFRNGVKAREEGRGNAPGTGHRDQSQRVAEEARRASRCSGGLPGGGVFELRP